MTKTSRSIFVLLFAATALVACGGGGGDGSSSNPPAGGSGSTPSDVSLDKLQGTWLGSFDPKGTMQAMQFTIDDKGNITNVSLGNDASSLSATDLTGTITKDANTPARTFHFVLQNQAQPPETQSQGMLLVDPAGSHMVFIDGYFDFGVLQKGATSLPTYAQTDVNNADGKQWSGDTVTAKLTSDAQPGFNTIAQKSSNGSCKADTPPTTSSCTFTLGNVSRAVSGLTFGDPLGRWGGNYTDTTSGGTPQSGTTRLYMSADKSFAGVWACQDFANGFPDTCDFSALTNQ